jgi:nitrilase
MARLLAVAICQAAPIPLDIAAGIAKAAALARDASASGARLVAFGETFLGGYPLWLDEAAGAALWNHPGTSELHQIMLGQAVTSDDRRLQPLQEIADNTGTLISIGAHERVRSSLYNAQLLFRPGQSPLVHRKLVPTHGERLIWARGDGSTLGVHAADWGRTGSLICWENWMPLARAAMHAQGVDVHIAAWPTVRDAYLVASQHYAFEGRCHVLAAGTVQHRGDLLDGLERVGAGAAARELILQIPDRQLQAGGSAIIAPDAQRLAGPAGAQAETLLAQIDLDARGRALAALDVDGHYSRPDIFSLTVNTTPQPGVRFSSDESTGELDVR